MLELVVSPSHRDDLFAIGRDLISAAFDVIAAEGGGRVDWWVVEPTPAHDELAAAMGLRPERHLSQMRRPLPTEERPTIETRPFVTFCSDLSVAVICGSSLGIHGMAPMRTASGVRRFTPES